MSVIKSIAQIKQEFEQSGDDKEALYVQYAGDSRKGVQNLITKYQKEAQKLVKERERLETMRFFEHKYSEYHAICGIDEAGRGSACRSGSSWSSDPAGRCGNFISE